MQTNNVAGATWVLEHQTSGQTVHAHQQAPSSWALPLFDTQQALHKPGHRCEQNRPSKCCVGCVESTCWSSPGPHHTISVLRMYRSRAGICWQHAGCPVFYERDWGPLRAQCSLLDTPACFAAASVEQHMHVQGSWLSLHTQAQPAVPHNRTRPHHVGSLYAAGHIVVISWFTSTCSSAGFRQCLH